MPGVKNLHGLHNFEKYFNPNNIISTNLYCDLINNLKNYCYQSNILELWNYDDQQLLNNSYEETLNRLNTYTYNPVTGHYQNYSQLLGGIQRDNNDQITKAATVIVSWYLYVNATKIDMNQVGNRVGTADWVCINLTDRNLEKNVSLSNQ